MGPVLGQSTLDPLLVLKANEGGVLALTLYFLRGRGSLHSRASLVNVRWWSSSESTLTTPL